MALNGKQIRQLRALAHHLSPVINIGKDNVGDGLVKQTEDALEAHELVKCAVQDGSGLTVQEAAQELAERTGSEIVQVIGRRFTLYRESSRKDFKHIELV